MGKDKVKVGVRVRPFNAREKAIITSGGGSSATIIQVSITTQHYFIDF